MRAYEGGACGGGWDGRDDYIFEKAELLYLLSKRVDSKELFKGFVLKKIDVDEVLEEFAKEHAFPDGCGFYSCDDEDYDPENEDYEDRECVDNYSVSCDCWRLESHLKAWEYLLNKVLSGEITEEELEGWMEFFDDAIYEDEEADIEEWYNDRKDEEEE